MLQHTHIRRRAQGRGSPPPIADTVRPGFTLIELLVAMSIMLILAVITIRLVGTTLDNDRLKSGSRELQSYLAGARDRASYAGQPRGVRFIPDATDPYSARSFVYIGAPTNFTDGQQIYLTNGSTALGPSAATIGIIYGLVNRGLLLAGSQITLGGSAATGGNYYSIAPDVLSSAPIWLAGGSYSVGQTVQPTTPNGHTYVCTATTCGSATCTSGTTQPTWPTTQGGQVTDNAVVWTEFSWALTKIFAGSSGLAAYNLQLAPAQLPSEQPRSLPQNVAIDLRTSILPTTWQFPPSPTSTYDLLFSPAGTVAGPAAASGRVHFVLADISETATEVLTNGLSNRLQLNAPWQASTSYVVGNMVVPTPSSYIAFRCTTAGASGAAAAQPTWPTQPNQTVTDNQVIWQSFVKKANTIVSVATSTGRITTHNVDITDANTPAGTGYDSFRYAEIGEVTQ
jgi:prepilin-type N-terminal cleavage/methylation domain-containing protein